MAANFSTGDELIIVNDFSADGTAGVLERLQKKYPVINIIHHKRNKGGAAARNTAVENARHNLLFCLDSDNVLAPNSIAPLNAFLIAEKADVACFNQIKYFSVSTDIIDEVWDYQAGIYTIEQLLRGELSPGGSGNYMFTKASWLKAGGYTEDMGALDTWSFGFKQLMEGCKMMVMPDSFYFHRRGHESYYIRDAWKKRRSVSLRLIKLIINYIDRINPADVEYIFSKKGRYSWFDNLAKRPVRLMEGVSEDAIWENHELKKGAIGTAVHKAKYYKSRITQKLRGEK